MLFKKFVLRREVLAMNVAGSSLVEILVALAILSLTFCLVSGVYISMNTSSPVRHMIRANSLAEKIIYKGYSPERGKDGEFIIKEDEKVLPEFPDCTLSEVTIFSAEKLKLAEISIVRKTDDR